MLFETATIILVIACLVLIFFKEKVNRNLFTVLCIVIALVYVYLMLQMTLLGREKMDEYQVEPIPFMSYYMLVSVGWYGWGVYIFYGLVSNVFVFIPVGALTSQLSKIKHKYLLSGIIGFVFSLAIEVTQYLTMLGTFEADDLIHNTWGAVIGCAIALALMRKEKSIRTNVKTVMPLVVLISVMVLFSLLSIIRDYIR